jgi:uncharacterized protein YcbX
VRVVELWRYPVKSLQGEQVEAVEVGPDGLEGDRQFAIFDLETGFGLTARRVPELLFATSRWHDGEVDITLPGGSRASTDGELSAWLGRPVTLLPATDDRTRTYENPDEVDDTTDRGWVEAAWEAFNGARGAFHDSPRSRVSLVTTSSLAQWDRRRFRANVLLDGQGEDALVGTTVDLGDAELEVRKRISRCVMTTRPQPGGIDRDLDVLRTINHERGGCLSIGALVTRSGTVRVGDELRSSPERS